MICMRVLHTCVPLVLAPLVAGGVYMYPALNLVGTLYEACGYG